MSQFLLLPSLLIIAAALGLRWWFGSRALAECDGPTCEAGISLRNRALARWAETDRRAAASRAGALRFGMATPPLALLVAAFAVLVGKIPVTAAIAVVLAITAVAAAFGILTLPAELAAIQKFRDNPEANEHIRRAAIAEAWNQSLPTALRAIFK